MLTVKACCRVCILYAVAPSKDWCSVMKTSGWSIWKVWQAVGRPFPEFECSVVECGDSTVQTSRPGTILMTSLYWPNIFGNVQTQSRLIRQVCIQPLWFLFCYSYSILITNVNTKLTQHSLPQLNCVNWLVGVTLRQLSPSLSFFVFSFLIVTITTGVLREWCAKSNATPSGLWQWVCVWMCVCECVYEWVNVYVYMCS